MRKIQKCINTTVIFSLIFSVFLNCKDDKKDDIDPLLILVGLASGSPSYNCSATVKGKVASLPAMTATTSIQTLVYGKVPFVNHSIAAVKVTGAVNGTRIVFTGRNVADFDEGTSSNENAPLIYNTSSCPLADSSQDTTRSTYTTSSEGQYGSAAGDGPYTYTLNATKGGDYYFVFYLASRTAESPTTTFQLQ
ncbi:hypothetical protein GS518_18845 [Leptospira interrogans]|uniref:Lipoprotein n=4 Tax=Leptospira interrogans TaxID=173 RepID=M6R8I4_LEPIR|nr:hypothetical protein [Leptospira interrogans]APH43427.1 Uncharacterized protein A9P81_3999 [Leptospira interrogans serovar Copenhageni/Icterohaemorrhagiae]EMG23037.1 hypothetical protein LEP1GSC150_1181 [Leptospira interrogans serovar Copenhageni str. LT2050]EMO03910.1 hypothetical protein LEP1GSC116_2018 [Leptospira interrogans serovar Icterohaemorrhagiae str. Verdun HP]OCC29535.1 Uncharacterized protein GNX_1900 [Leptospira interrogans serovar Canicola]AAS72181.1 conserved hypothetical pr